MINSDLIEIEKFNFNFFNCYKAAQKIVAIAIKFDDISSYGAIVVLIDADKNEHQLTKKKVKWSDLIQGLGLMTFRDIDIDRTKLNYYKSEIQKHNLILIKKVV